MSCPAKLKGEVPRRGRASIEFRDKQGKPVYYCMGYVDKMNDELIGTCAACRQNVKYAQEDFEKAIKEREHENIKVPPADVVPGDGFCDKGERREDG